MSDELDTNPDGPDHRAEVQRFDPKWIKSPAVRKSLYGIAIAVGALLVGYGLITKDEAALWANLVGQIIMIGSGGLALANTPKS